jgi:predicted RNA binding protein YcfA (HicA-like mRNA interferase family)
MQNKEVERALHAKGFFLLRNGRKHALYSNGRKVMTVSHGRMSPGAYKKIMRELEMTG